MRTSVPVNTLDGVVDSNFQRIDTNTYVEFGLTDKTMLGAKVVYGTSWLTRGSSSEAASGFAELEFFAQQQLWRSRKSTGAIKAGVTRPSQFLSGARPDLQSDGVDVEAAFLYGRNLTSGPIKVFTSTQAGYRKRFSDSADQVRFEATLGAEPGNKWLILLDAFATVSVRNEAGQGADYDIYKVQPSIVWQASRLFKIQAGISEEFAGRNTSRGRTVFLGLWSSF